MTLKPPKDKKLDAVPAWAVYALEPEPPSGVEEPLEWMLLTWKALYTVVHQKPPPDHPPPLRDAVRLVAKLGGFLGRKRDGEPGTTTIWRGLTRLEGIAIGFKAALSLVHSRDGP